ncbi:hypothetical protein CEUSTIGMA_g1484.t1 [Chlamydomonas eustigma]|uniref:Plastid lipid-associated protein/fibrillin conserved domain-containing protein n=1 Tax=Chlamydomonas eustigma TaxID=1157962 RepID=A0A250WT81_9CHLO|nr:hypothetical protein CEUSTIGMA_g1484.t1 [Chlamydomonas eustigma]|eukprot:GAX74034.1 hypothetical protein CEUSTIGMA_g1484.t1 [Chlamydomonas eustigma]
MQMQCFVRSKYYHNSGLLGRRVVRRSAPTNTVSLPVQTEDHADLKALVDDIICRVEGTDGGINLSDAQKDEIDLLLDKLREAGKGSRPVKDPRLIGNYVVVYTSTRRAPGQKGQAAGGRFRGALGRSLFKTTGVFQSVLAGDPPIAVNKVAFNLLGLIPGYVGLRGRVEPFGDDDESVSVYFDPPILSFAGKLHLRIGPKSSVQLATTYLDERIRVGLGSRGSLFLFTRGGAADAADMDLVGQQRTSWVGVAAVWAFLAILVVTGALLWASANPLARVAAIISGFLTVGISAVLNRGGIIQDDKEINHK